MLHHCQQTSYAQAPPHPYPQPPPRPKTQLEAEVRLAVATKTIPSSKERVSTRTQEERLPSWVKNEARAAKATGAAQQPVSNISHPLPPA